jgi:hypothetical protein
MKPTIDGPGASTVESPPCSVLSISAFNWALGGTLFMALISGPATNGADFGLATRRIPTPLASTRMDRPGATVIFCEPGIMRSQLRFAAGLPGTSLRVGREWIGWNQVVAHPAAPQGAGGPGNFSPPLPLNADDQSDLPSPWRPGAAWAEPLDTSPAAPKPPNPPPLTNPKSLGVIKQVTKDFVDYKIEGEIVADGSGGVSSGAKTTFSQPGSTSPGYESSGGKITKFAGKFTFNGTIRIQTKYAADSTVSTLSCYGRGTTDADVKNRDITLGFHESCHRADYEAFLTAHALPDPPDLSIGMPVSDYEKAVSAFRAALKQYYADMDAQSVNATDEVGFTLSKSNKTKSCYVHLLP